LTILDSTSCPREIDRARQTSTGFRHAHAEAGKPSSLPGRLRSMLHRPWVIVLDPQFRRRCSVIPILTMIDRLWPSRVARWT
jgi:hypothetical protein